MVQRDTVLLGALHVGDVYHFRWQLQQGTFSDTMSPIYLQEASLDDQATAIVISLAVGLEKLPEGVASTAIPNCECVCVCVCVCVCQTRTSLRSPGLGTCDAAGNLGKYRFIYCDGASASMF